MDLDNVDPELILARGRYATLNGYYKDLMNKIQELSQDTCDEIRKGLRDGDPLRFEFGKLSCASLERMAKEAAELKAQKDELYRAAWGK
jgi:hypothetical protein